jgi:hypothetical protein
VSIDVDMTPAGLLFAGESLPVTGKSDTARQRLGLESDGGDK